MKRKKIVIVSIFAVFLLLLLPSVSAVNFNTFKEKKLSFPIEKTNIPPYIWFAIFILILAIANRLLHPETSGVV